MKVKLLRENALLPKRATPLSAGLDLFACLDEDIFIDPNETAKIPTGIAVALAHSTAGLVFARSGLALKEGLAPANCVGVIDEDYRGEVTVALHNHSNKRAVIKNHDRIAQLVITPIIYDDAEETEKLDDTTRGQGGFGSTGR